MKFVFDNKEYQTNDEITILNFALKNNCYIPTLCHLSQTKGMHGVASSERLFCGEEIDPSPQREYEGCSLCLVSVNNKLVKSCEVIITDGMNIITDSPEIQGARREAFSKLMKYHPHACLLCPQKDGCSRTQCSSNVPENERCCELLGSCEIGKLVDYIGLDENLGRFAFPNIPVIEEPIIERNYNLCIGCLRCVSVCEQLRNAKVLGFAYLNDRFIAGSIKKTLIESECRSCTLCVEACPTGALLDKDRKTTDKENVILPCKPACPIEMNVPAYIRAFKNENYEEGMDIITNKTPFPEILGRACFHPCETACKRNKLTQNNEPNGLAIREIKLNIAKKTPNYISTKINKYNLKQKEKKIGIIGAGPAGLTSAFYLSLLGYKTTVFEQMEKPGGMLHYAIPEYRIPVSTVENEIRNIENKNLTIITNKKIKDPEALLNNKEFDSIIIATGNWNSFTLNIKNKDNINIVNGLDFLVERKKEKQDLTGKNVAVIGGGNVAFDTACSAIKDGASTVTILYRRTINYMPAHKEEITNAIKNNVKIEELIAPVSIKTKDNKLYLTIIKTKLISDNTNKRPTPIPIEGTEEERIYDLVISAIGQGVEEFSSTNIETEKNGAIVSDPDSCLTNIKNIYCIGDASGFQNKTIVNAIASGRKVASVIDKNFGGNGILPFDDNDGEANEIRFDEKAGLPLCGRQEDVSKEAMRCFSCDMRLKLNLPPEPPTKIQKFNKDNINTLPEEAGVFVLFDKNKKPIFVSGVASIKDEISDHLDKNDAMYFEYELNEMYTIKESELIQKYLQEYGAMPRYNDLDDDLF